MGLDKKIWQEAIVHYEAWNEAKLRQDALNAGKKTPQQKWEEYKGLFAFARRIKPEPSEREHRKHVEEWDGYHESIVRFEEWRKRGGRKA